MRGDKGRRDCKDERRGGAVMREKYMANELEGERSLAGHLLERRRRTWEIFTCVCLLTTAEL